MIALLSSFIAFRFNNDVLSVFKRARLLKAYFLLISETIVFSYISHFNIGKILIYGIHWLIAAFLYWGYFLWRIFHYVNGFYSL